MIDFVEYVVAELANKRLSKSEAISLIRQFQSRSKSDPGASRIHPLLHTNLSDLYQQSYSSRLDGSEFFLRDHQVNGKSILPGVAYLEMARIAVATALAPNPGDTIELRNVVWAQPISVSAPTDVSINLLVDGSSQIDFEVSSAGLDAAEETVHSRGIALIAKMPAPLRHDLARLAGQMTRGHVEAPALYGLYEKLGISYGPAHCAVTAIEQGEQQLLARLMLPDAVEDTLADYLLHPSIMDAAVQSALGFIDDIDNPPDQLRLPFALDTLRIFAPCTRVMVAWLRYAEGSQASDATTKLDIDLCDTEGNVCVQLLGFTSRILNREVNVQPLYATTAWEARALDVATESPVRYSQHHIVLCGFPDIDGKRLAAEIPGSACVALPQGGQDNCAARYAGAALACFELIKGMLAENLQEQALVQVVVAGSSEQETMIGLSGLLKSASRENPALTGQVVVSDPRSSTQQLSRQLQQEAGRASDAVVKYDAQGGRQVLALRELLADGVAGTAFKERGVYLVTGGLGALGMLFARDILARCSSATVILSGRSALNADTEIALTSIGSRPGAVLYRQLDLADAGQTSKVLGDIVSEHGRLDGIIHAAGMIADSFILKKSAGQFLKVLEPKVAGSVNLDQASKDMELDFFVLFSAGAAVTGNVGQADYAAANGFMDRFAAHRNELLSLGQRKGQTRAINWPLWLEGGMGTDAPTREYLQKSFGMHPLRTATGLQAFHRSLAWPHAQLQVVEGEPARLRDTLFGPASAPVVQPVAGKTAGKAQAGNVLENTHNYLKKQLSQVLKLPVNRIDAAAPFEKYGIDSIMMVDLTNVLETSFGSLPKTLFFEYQSLAELSRYFVKCHADRLAALFGEPESPPPPVAPVTIAVPPAPPKPRRLRQMPPAATGQVVAQTGPIAIVGLSGRYPNSPDIEAFWANLRDGKDCVVEVPRERWDWQQYFTDDRTKPGYHYSKWGGFIDGVDEFDPLFFNISPREARLVDPQERLFLQHAWMAVEDAGYTRASLQIPRKDGQAGMVGVYVGVMYGEYNLSGSLASIANRVSYVLNLHGPSLTLDSMCSSSLTAIHLACQDLKEGRTDVGIAGGVNVSIHPSKYLLLSAGQFISSDGHCQSFGEGGDGYIPGEGVGAVLLKRLADAERDGDHIYGIIKGSALNHGGKTNGYTVPNPHAQASVIRQALAQANTDPRHVSYIEAHGTGTKLGDPIEILALSNAFYQDATSKDVQFCAIGSAKSNIGHCESAAGIAGITKILLQMKHGQIVPSLHSTRLNPNIDFAASPFTVNQSLRAWDRPVLGGRELARIAGMSSFGAGGSNAHIVLEEYVARAPQATEASEFIIVLSARTSDQLKQKARDLLAFAGTCTTPLASIAYTLQAGREAMDERLGFVTGSIVQLQAQLSAYLRGDSDIEGAALGQAKSHNDALSLFSDDDDLQQTIAKWVARKNLPKLLAVWVRGMSFAWDQLHGDVPPQRCSLPTYPFAKDKYWIETVGQVVPDAVAGAVVQAAVLHPLLHRNTSSLEQQRYSSRFGGDEWFAGMAPGLLLLEMARVAVESASQSRPESGSLDLRNIAWGKALDATADREVSVALFADESNQIAFDIYSEGLGQEQVHCQGHAAFSELPAPKSVAIAALKGRMQQGDVDHPGIVAMWQGQHELLVQLSLRSDPKEEGAWLLHPSAMGCMLKAASLLSGSAALPASLEMVRIVFGCVNEMVVWVRPGQGNALDVDFCDLHGNVCVQMRGLSLQSAPAAIAPVRRTVSLAATDLPAAVSSVTVKPKAIMLLAPEQWQAAGKPPEPARAPVRLAAMPVPVVVQQAPVNVTGEQLVQQLKSSLADALYMDVADIDVAKPFVELGLDSIVGVEWIKAINKQNGLNLSATKVYDYPTIAALASLIAGEMGGRAVPAAPVAPLPAIPEPQPAVSNDQLLRQLKASLAEALYMDVSDIDPAKLFVELGLDSIVGVEWVKAINKQYGLALSATKVYDYPTIASLASLIAGELGQLPATVAPVQTSLPVEVAPMAVPAPANDLKRRSHPARMTAASTPAPAEKIAIIGMSGRYPQANNLREFWDNLAQGKNAIVEIPPSRWDVNQYYDPVPGQKGKIYCKWLGMLDDADCFDPLFFQISPAEAEVMDPQHRLFMQEAYKAFEDAGYSNKTLSNKKCGVYLGIMNNEYSLLLSRAGSDSVDATGTSYAIGAARIAYFLNLKGPAIPIDTACSSSLVGIHLACQGLLNGEIDLALAGGATLYLTPDSYLGMCQAGMLSPDGQCKTFDNGANGFVPGEGAGAVVLKRLSDAQADNDHIYGVILGSAINQDGKTNGITAPSVNSQIELERQLYAKCNIDPETITYVETHGTGTKLGDPIELEALSTVFSEKTARKNYCALGSVKSNIGHTSAAAGVASVQKVLLSMMHRTLAPSLNVDKENALFDFQDSPFYICRDRQAWKAAPNGLRRAAVSSFGFSGTNAHLVLEEYAAPVRAQRNDGQAAIPLSARTQAQLAQKVRDLLDFVQIERTQGELDLGAIAYTLQTGRESFKERLCLVAGTVDQLAGQLQALIAGAGDNPGIYQGQAGRDKATSSSDTVNNWIASKNLSSLADVWVKGVDIDWGELHAGAATPPRISLPTYPFARDRYWIAGQAPVASVEVKQRTYYTPRWNASPLAPSAAIPLARAPTLVFDTSDTLFLALGKRFGHGMEQPAIVLAMPGDTYAEIAPNVFTLDVTNKEQFLQLVGDLTAREMFPQHVVHHCPQWKPQELDLRLDHGVFALFYLCKALMAQKQTVRTRMLSVFGSTSEQEMPEYAALGAFFKTLTLENPNFLAKIVDIRAGLDGTADLLMAELADPNWQAVDVRYEQSARDGRPAYRRSTRELARFIPQAASPAELPLKQGGVYLITGGLGGLGFIFAQYLLEHFGARLVLVGRSAPSAAQIDRLGAHAGQIVYLQGDVCNALDMERVVQQAKARFSCINGVIHSAGVIRDGFMLKKTRDEFASVVAAKVQGAINLDLACAGENLDLFVMFSSLAGTLGNAGQCDYAYANHFLDAFAESRQRQRPGKTLSIAWPLWSEGGMRISDQDIATSERQLGISVLPTFEGIAYWEDFLRSPLTHGVALYGMASKIDARLTRPHSGKAAPAALQAPGADSVVRQEDTELYLRSLIGLEIKLAPELIDPQERFDAFGIDSIVVGRLNASLAGDLGDLPKTLFYEYQNVEELATYLCHAAPGPLLELLGGNATVPVAAIELAAAPVRLAVASAAAEPIAIIGMHGAFPQCANLQQYWENLKLGKDLVALVPAERWDYQAYFHADPEQATDGKIYCKWGGFVDDVDKFDAAFFNISAREARLIDPQERLFLQSAWSAIEDAGYTRDSLRQRHPKAKSADVGVFVGVTTNSYNLLQADEWERGNITTPSSLPWSIANRVSYFFDFQGPSMPVDTACSSSLVAIHLACESLNRQECQAAIAGGVNLYLHPSKYHSFCQRGMLAMEGKCRSFGAGDDGFVPAEAVGTLVLKRLSRAIADGDQIHAVIAGSAVEHGGRSNGYSAPNPQSQASVIGQALDRAGVPADSIGYVEGHGTGTQLGDNLEITALTQAFGARTAKKQFCAVGSVKANMGHAESAAGIVGIAKIVLQMKHRLLVPTIHSMDANPNIAFSDSPFYLQHGLAPWEAAEHPRRSLINSFGAGGVNACLIVEEYIAPQTPVEALVPQLIVLSAKTAQGLAQQVELLLARLQEGAPVDLAALSYTLQVGREAMPERLALIAGDVAELVVKLAGEQGVYRGSVEPRRKKAAKNKVDALEHLYASRDLPQLAERWIAGDDIAWERLYATQPPRMSLPTYPFAKDRHWVSDHAQAGAVKVAGPAQAALHPLISYNSSTLSEVTFSSWLSADEFYAQDHRVNGQPMFPGSGYLEIACVSGAIAGGKKVRKLRDIVWIQPLIFDQASKLVQIALQSAQDSVEYMITSFAGHQKVVHAEGMICFDDGSVAQQDASVPPARLIEQGAKQLDPDHYYDLFETSGISYGPAFRTMKALHVGPGYALSKLSLAEHLRGNFDQFVLHPSIIDGALQTVAALVGKGESATPFLPFAIDEVELLRPLSATCYVYVEHAQGTPAANGDVMKFDIKVINAAGDVLINIRHFCVRSLDPAAQAEKEARIAD